jgi:hypothetical protein
MNQPQGTCEVKQYEVPRWYNSNSARQIITVIKAKDQCFEIKDGDKYTVIIQPIKKEACSS